MAKYRLVGLVAVLALLGGCQQDPAVELPATPAEEAPTDGSTPAADLTGEPGLQSIGSFSRPTYVSSPPGDPRIFVVEQDGRVVEAAGGGPRTPAFIDIRDQVGCCGERGLFSIAFAPDYVESG
ncbi:MAG: hypothetical protein WD178_10750, partial [Actinomycetota bacterium]